jgi:hypothetical protein
MHLMTKSGAVLERSKRVEFDKTSTYHVGKSVAAVDSVFRTDGSAITDILSRLIRLDTERGGQFSF